MERSVSDNRIKARRDASVGCWYGFRYRRLGRGIRKLGDLMQEAAEGIGYAKRTP